MLGDDRQAVRPDQRARRGGVGRAAGADHGPGAVDLHQAAGVDIVGAPALEGREHVPVRQPLVAVREREPRRLLEGAEEPRGVGIGQIEAERRPCHEAVGQERPAGGHAVLGVMGVGPAPVGGEGGDHAAVAGAFRIGVEHRQEVAVRPVDVSGPGDEPARGRTCLLGRLVRRGARPGRAPLRARGARRALRPAAGHRERQCEGVRSMTASGHERR